MPKTSNARPDRRYSDPTTAPAIVSEKRLTFFLPETTNRALKLLSGKCQIANVEDESNELPETPSAIVRFAVDHLLASLNGKGLDLAAMRKAAK